MYDKFFDEVFDKLSKQGIKQGTVLYVTGDLKGLFYLMATTYGVNLKESKDDILDELTKRLQALVGKEGTILIPAFSWAFCRGLGFDVNSTKSEVGVYSNWILDNRKDFKRTAHAIYSFCVWGKDADKLLAMDNQDAWGEYSVFTYLKNVKALQLNIGIESFQGLTFAHYVEQCANVPYRHLKYFFGNYKNAEGVSEVRMYSMNVRDMDVSTGVALKDSFLLERGCAGKFDVSGVSFTVIDLNKSYPFIYDDIVNNNGAETLYFNSGCLDWSKGKTLPYEIGTIPTNGEQ